MHLAASSALTASVPAPAEVGATGFYVAVRTGARAHAALALGPFDSHRAARLEVDRVREFVTGGCREAGWWLYETTRVTAQPGRELPAGTLNALLACGQSAA
ncbi:hypothetical protein [Actinomadura sp. KC216]|uniref:hypothetical protein n=1 Tax=Actinomadura sp. KC216 TaxID=2530370 RepID=UPI001404A2E4|nr:hypothetical protein [Actinomadura sp. KC216]